MTGTVSERKPIHNMGDLVSFIFFSDDWTQDLITIFIKIMQAVVSQNYGDLLRELLDILIREVMKQVIISMVGEAIQQIASQLNAYAEHVIIDAWAIVRAQYSGFPHFGFGSSGWNAVKSMVYDFLKDPFIQVVYIESLTSPSIDRARGYSQNFQFQGTFPDAFEKKSRFVAQAKTEIELAEEVSRGLRQAANLLMVTANILDWISSIVPTGLIGDILDQASRNLKISAYINIITGLTWSGYEFFNTPLEMEDTVDDIYFPGGQSPVPAKFLAKLPGAKLSREMLAEIKSNLQNSLSQYDSTIAVIKQEINSGNSAEGVLKLQALWDAEQRLVTSMKTAVSPVYAVANVAIDSIGSFPAMYDSLKAYYAYAGEERLKNYVMTFPVVADSSQAVKDTIFAQLDRAVQRNHLISDQITTTLDTVALHLDIPPVLVASYTYQSAMSLKSSENAEVQVRIKNLGSLTAENVSVVFTINNALKTEQNDSIFLGNLSPGAESGILSWTVSIFDPNFTRGIWSADIRSSNAKTYASSGSFGIAQPGTGTPATGGKLTNQNIYNYPNPFNPDRETTTLRYSLEKSAEVTIKIYDAGGNLVRTVLDHIQQNAAVEQAIMWDGKERGRGDCGQRCVFLCHRNLPGGTGGR